MINTANEKINALENVSADECETKTAEARVAYDALKYDTPKDNIKHYNHPLLSEK